MQKIAAFFSSNKYAIITVLSVLVIIAIIYYWGKKSGSGNTQVVDDQGNAVQFTDSQLAEAREVSSRIYNDLESGWLFGNNIWGNIGRDSDAYYLLSQMSDSLFALTVQVYKQQYNRSLIADIRAENSLPTDTFVRVILSKADRLNIV